MISNFIGTLKSGSLTIALLFIILFSSPPAKSQNKFLAFYRDTTIIHKDYILTVDETFIRSSLFLTSMVRLYNPTTQFVILDYKSAFATGEDGVPQKCKNNEDAVFLPGGNYKQHFKFQATPRSKKITFRFPKVWVTDTVKYDYAPLDVSKTVGTIKKTGNISVETLKVRRTEKAYIIRVRIRYDGDEFLVINFPNISVTGEQSGLIYNKIRPHHRMHHRKSKYLEMATLTFPIQKGEKIEKTIRFENVFKIYSLKELKGFDLSYTLYKDENKVTMRESDVREREVNDDE